MMASDDPSTVQAPTVKPWACRPHPILVAAGLSVPLWCAILGGTALAVAGVRELLEAEAEAEPGTTLLPGKMFFLVGPAPQQGEPPTALLLTAGLDPGPGGADGPEADRLAPEPLPDPARVDPAAGLEHLVHERVAAHLRELGLAATSAPPVLSDSSLDQVAAGQAAGPAATDDGAGADRDPQFDALNRVLVEKGGVLLPAWTFEVQPELLYSYKGSTIRSPFEPL